MKLVHPELRHSIFFPENRSQIMVIENQTLFYQYVQDVYCQCNQKTEGKFVLSHEDAILDFSKNAFVCVNPLDLDLSERKLITYLYKELRETVYHEELYLQTTRVLSEIERYYSEVIEQVDYDLDYQNELDITGLFKLADLKFADRSESLVEKIIDYIEVMQKLMHIEIGIFVNLKSFLNQNQLKELYKMMRYRKMKLLLIENHAPDELLEEEELYIIDSDGCEIYEMNV